MNMKKLKELVELMDEKGLALLELEEEGFKVKLSKTSHGIVEQVISPAIHAAALAQSAEPTGKVQQNKKGKEVKSPMVGTFYRSPAPNESSYVEVGDVVNEGDVLCIVEAMKLMNEVKAEFGGKIVEISAENAEPVEYGQVLFVVAPA